MLQEKIWALNLNPRRSYAWPGMIVFAVAEGVHIRVGRIMLRGKLCELSKIIASDSVLSRRSIARLGSVWRI